MLAELRKERLPRSAKARIDRMAQSHSRRKELDVPQWLNDDCKSGNKTRIARQLQDAKFNQVTCWRPKKTHDPSASAPKWFNCYKESLRLLDGSPHGTPDDGRI